MNIILFEEHELGHDLPKRDERTIHLLKVLKKKQGHTFDAGILDGLLGTGKIERINFDGSIFFSFKPENPPAPRFRLRIAFAFVRPIQMRRILRELSNIGVSAIDIISTDTGEKSYRDTKMLSDGGAYSALVEGAIQARDTKLPTIDVYDSLDEWIEKRPWQNSKTQMSFERTPLLFAMDNVRAEGSMFHLSPSSRPAIVAIGPERGWSDRERELFDKSGFLRLSMGTRALRTETACVAASILAMRIIEN